MELVLTNFFNNDELNNELVMVTGEDLCAMLHICFFLAGEIHKNYLKSEENA